MLGLFFKLKRTCEVFAQVQLFLKWKQLKLKQNMVPLNEQQLEVIKQVAWMLILRDQKKEFLSRTDLDEDVRSMTERDIVKIHDDMKKDLNIN